MKSFDAYGSSTGDSWTTATLGEKSLSGNVEFALTCKGKNSSSSGYDLKVDYIELVPVGGGDAGGSSGGGTTTAGNGGVVSSTIIVKAGETFDGGGKRYIADKNTLGEVVQSFEHEGGKKT
ncbi:hypothetical protein WMF27_24430 [Sorangium sp. So ce281]|uniref:hypothetical protein n=1 Tax=unclassified Sorangium TaxID=2621164 RepID=UPI003F5E9067